MTNSKVAIFNSENAGKCVIATSQIEQDEIIATFDGDIYSWFENDVANEYPHFIRDHAIQFHPNMCRHSSGIARWVNHSCNPNCGIRDLFNIISMRSINPGEEVTWDYEMTENDEWRMECTCGASNCRKVIRGYRFLPKERREAYEGYLSDWHFDPYIAERMLDLSSVYKKLENHACTPI